MAATIGKGLALFQDRIPGPTWFPRFTGALHSRQEADAHPLSLTGGLALLISLKSVAAVVTSAVAEGHAGTHLAVIIPVHVTLSTAHSQVYFSQAVCWGEWAPHWHLRIFREIVIRPTDDRQGIVCTKNASRIPCNADVDTCIPHLRVVNDKLTDVGDNHVAIHLVRPHDQPLAPFTLFLPCYIRSGGSNNVTVEADCASHIDGLVVRVGVQRGGHGVLLGGCRGGVSCSVLRQWTGVGPGQVKAAGDHGYSHPTDAGLCVHEAVVEVGEAI
ncbi:hypothetical protein EPR50_G00013360 [Perca flavescens]|uniref:Uncharacterized protein n=1 Tax=Perca flavescens TaxID=8167 RepID=A0A484DK45_PERFV|nr:hypothetical protein EPR50_G00013360 [Perca flavescens]